MLPLRIINSLTSEEIEFPFLQGGPRVAGEHWKPKKTPPPPAEHSAERRIQPKATLMDQLGIHKEGRER